jgi:arginyl-tRNA synthetase
MLTVKTELLQALRLTLDQLMPGAGEKCAFESPKVAAHGDLATTVAMQLAKPSQTEPAPARRDNL